MEGESGTGDLNGDNFLKKGVFKRIHLKIHNKHVFLTARCRPIPNRCGDNAKLLYIAGKDARTAQRPIQRLDVRPQHR